MKVGTTRMAYKAGHSVDLDTDIVVAATVPPGNAPDTQTIIDMAIDAAVNAEEAGVENGLQAIVADKGHHSTTVVTLATDLGDAGLHPRADFVEPVPLDRQRSG